MNIAVISTPAVASWGGSEELWAAMADKALKAGHGVTVSPRRDLYHPPTKLAELQSKGARILDKPVSIKCVDRIIGEMRTGIHYKTLFSTKPNVVLINNGGGYEGLFSKSLIRALYKLSVPYVINCRLIYETGFITKEYREIAAEFFQRACCVVCPSYRNLAIAERHLTSSLSNGIVLHSPVKFVDFGVITWPSSNIFYMANVARLEPIQKGQDILFETLQSQVWKSRNWRLRMYGSGKGREYLEKLAIHYGIEDRVEFLGYVDDVRAIWSQNHLLVLPSRDEGTPIALIEAMLCGRPSVVTDVGGNTEWVEDGLTGFVAESTNIKMFNDALEKAWQSRMNWPQMGKSAHESAWAKYDKDPGNSLLKILIECS